MWEVCQAEAVRSASCQGWEEEALGSVSHRRAWKSALLLETAFGCFPPRGTDEARLFPRHKPLPKLLRSEPDISEGEFPVLGISHLPEEPFTRVPRFPPRFAGASR